MLTQELRIFNYIDKVKKSEDDFNDYYKVKRISYNEHRNEETSVIDCIGNKHAYFSFLISDWKPIELIEEWLLRFGFEKWKNYYFIDSYYRIAYIIDHFAISVGDDDNGIVLRKVQYVHELQNLYYALIEKELKDEK